MMDLSLHIHLIFTSLAFAIFTVSFVVGIVFLLQESQIKSRHFGKFASRLPPLETIDALHYKVLTVGFLFLSIGILAGAVLSKIKVGRFITGDERQMAALGMWALYAIFLNIRLKVGWRGRRGILLSIIGFAAVALTFLALKHRM